MGQSVSHLSPPLIHLDSLHPGLKDPAITRAKKKKKISACFGLFTLVATKQFVRLQEDFSDFYTMSKVLLLTLKGTYSCGCCLLHLQDIPCISPASRAQLESQVCEEEPLETTSHSCGTCSLLLLSVYCSLSS